MQMIKNIKQPFPYILLLLFSLVACTEKINVQLDETYTRIVVDGRIATDTMPYQVVVTKTADYFYNEPSPPVTNAHLTISDGDSVFELAETYPGISGIYQTRPDFYGKPGRTYTLHIELHDAINGNSNYTASSNLYHVAHLDSTRAIFHENYGKEGVWEIQCFARDPADEENYYMFNLYRNGKLMTDSINKVRVSDDKLINGSYFNGGVIYLNNSRANEKLYKGDTITLQMSGITKAYMEFVNQVQQAGFNFPFFSGPPANIVGNISNGGVGFFVAYSNSSASTVIK
jgi:hypothetical protein